MMKREKKKEAGDRTPSIPWQTSTVWPLGGGSGIGLVVAGDGDAPLAAA